ncbi:MAG: ABC transporter ATP-binding protein [Oscillospiraceae bacterium]|nr:ABC transporter ATP-binding protein [Oscillospiraceae bacterium]
MKRNKRTPAAREYFRAFYEKNHIRYWAAMVLSVLSIGVNLFVTWLLGAMIDIIAAGEVDRLMGMLWVWIGLAVFTVTVDTASYWAKLGFVRRALVQYKALAFRRLSEKSISAFSQENTGRYLSTLTNDVTTIESNYLEKPFEMAAYMLTGVGAFMMMIWYSPLLAAADVLLGLLPIAAVAVTGGALAKREKAVSDQNESFMAQIKDLLSGFSVIKSFKAEEETQKRFNGSNQTLENVKYRRRWCEALIGEASGLCGLVMQMGIFFLGAYLAIRGDITAGTVIMFINLSGYVLNAINILPKGLANRRAAAGLVEKLAEVTEENAGRAGDPVPPVLKDAITLENVTFGYEPGEPVLRDLSMRLEAGKKYALVGGSGSGKSTLLNLLMGAYDGYEGSVAIDGKELREIDTDSLYDVMSLIGQNVFLFDDTLYQNITMFRDFPEDKLELAVHRAGLDGLIEQRGENYRCGENGNGLSGGERQRVSIARCLMRETPVLLLDEATAALDNQTAFAVTDAILHLDGLTRMVVTHRLEAELLEQYDEIFVLRGGEVCERGRFGELMERKEYFYSLYNVTNG